MKKAWTLQAHMSAVKKCKFLFEKKLEEYDPTRYCVEDRPSPLYVSENMRERCEAYINAKERYLT